MPIRQVQRFTLVEQVISTLEELIASEEWPVGSKVPAEPELVASLGVSRNTVREAVRALTHSGLLDPRPGDGTYVRATSGLDAALERLLRRSSAVEVLEVRRMLERDAARTAALRRTEADVRDLEACLDRRTQAHVDGDLDAFVDADLLFHQAVMAATRNRVLIELYANLTESVRVSVVEVLIAPARPNQDQTDTHTALAAAIRDRDPDRAEQAVISQLSDSRAILDDGALGHGEALDRGGA